MPIDPDALFPKLVDLLLDPVFVVDEEGRIVFVSTACESLLGYTQQEMIGSWIMDYVHPGDRERTRAASARVIKGASHIDFENRYLRKDGRVVHILWSARWSEADRARIAVARDVTALKHSGKSTCPACAFFFSAPHGHLFCRGCNEIKTRGSLIPFEQEAGRARALCSAPIFRHHKPPA